MSSETGPENVAPQMWVNPGEEGGGGDGHNPERGESSIDITEIRPPDKSLLLIPSELVSLDDVSNELLEGPSFVRENIEAVIQSAAGAAAVRIARQQLQLGVHETGGEDCGVPLERYVHYFGHGLGPLPWCAFFVSWCFAQAGHRPPWRNPGYAGSILEWAQGNGRRVAQPAHGDIFGFGDSHTGLVAGANPSAGQIYTVEGNWSDRVLSRLLDYRSINNIWFARF